MKDLLISIKPMYVNLIKKKIKKYEFRKKKIKQVDNVYIYETNPTKKITLIIKFGKCLEGTPKEIWKICKEYSGIKKKEFFEYYKNKQKAYAYEIIEIKEVNMELSEITKRKFPPQSFYYIENN